VINHAKQPCLYADDVHIYSNGWDRHLQQIELALTSLKDTNISFSPRKTEIGAPEIEYLD